jgi:hypothetical protein
VECADSEQRLALSADVAELVIEGRRPFEERELGGVLSAFGQEPGVDDPATGKRQRRLLGLQDLVRSRETSAQSAVLTKY